MSLEIVLFVALFLTVAIPLCLATVRKHKDDNSNANDVEYYKQTLEEISRKKESSLITESEYEATKSEIYRKLLALSNRSVDNSDTRISRRIVLNVIAVLLLIGIITYSKMGAFGYYDFPLHERLKVANDQYKERPKQKEYLIDNPAPTLDANVPQRFLTLLTQLRQVVQQNPMDEVGLKLLAQNESKIGEWDNAIEAQLRLIGLKAEQASAEDYAFLGQLMVEQTQGYVSPEAESFFRKALDVNRNNRDAKFFMGVMFAQNGRPDTTFTIWSQLLEEGGDEYWVDAIKEDIEEFAIASGKNGYDIPEDKPLSGPTDEDVRVASQMSAEDRKEMIWSMVSNLEERLYSEGGTEAEWARLVIAVRNLGREDLEQVLERAAMSIQENGQNMNKFIEIMKNQ